MNMDNWLNLVEQRFLRDAPDLLSKLAVYSSEARFGRQYIDEELASVSSGDKVLEIGAGSFLLSCQLVREGFNVTALEPVGKGFSHFTRIKKIVLNLAAEEGCLPIVLSQTGESLDSDKEFTFVFSINVMEHVENPELVIERVVHSLCDGGVYRFTCPNYYFPYEPHFDIPTLLSKSLTLKCFKNQIVGGKIKDEPLQMWNSLNWINPLRIRRACHKIPGLYMDFNKRFFSFTLSRVISDSAFASRRSKFIRIGVSWLVTMRAHRLFDLLPVCASPAIDCRIKKHIKDIDISSHFRN